MDNWEIIILHQVQLIAKEKGLIFEQLSIKEQYQYKYEIALSLLRELS